MTTHIQRPDAASELRHLKDFQRLSVDLVFRRMYEDPNPTRRFLVADEVGLGKTLVARGLITRAIEYLWDRVERIDIIYLCSNADIARQNVRRLTPHGISGVSLASRITLLPIETHDLKKRRVNVIALTPGTSLDLKGNLGVRRERALLLAMLAPHWKLDWTGSTRVFAGYAALQPFKSYARYFEKEHPIDPDLRGSFLAALDRQCADEQARNETTIRQRVEQLVTDYSSENPGKELNERRTAVIGELRQSLARSCIRALQPDLIVLDEFQRFKELLDGEGPAGEMAKHLFEYKDASTETRVLLLSATPYKMYTVQDDAGNEDHYADFLRTVRFLYSEDPAAGDRLGILLQEYREELFRLGRGGADRLASVRDEIESLLRRVIVRTERLAVTPDRSGMLVEKSAGAISIRAEDACNYARIQKLARLIESADTMEYWKAAPWLLNFMDKYKLREDIDHQIDDAEQSPQFQKAMADALPSLLSFDDMAAFRRLDPAHGRLRWLIDHTMVSGLWKLLWLPPTLPYYELTGVFADAARQSPTKSLLFSAWRVVPRVVAAVLSHEAERRMYTSLEGESADLTGVQDRLGDQLRVARRKEKAAGMTVLALMYPSVWMARACDPLRLAADLQREPGRAPTLEDVLSAAEVRIRAALESIIPATPQRSTPDESWYWAAPILLDRASKSQSDDWYDHDLAALWGGGDEHNAPPDEDAEEEEDDPAETEDDDDAGVNAISGLDEIVNRVRATARGEVPGGTPPKDLVRMLALISIAGPATVALRSFSRVAGSEATDSDVARDSAACVGAGFKTLFNQPDSTAVIKATTSSGDYWKECLEYSAMGGLQAVLDEYAHLLLGEAGVFGKSADEIIATIAGYMTDVVGLRRARVGAQNIVVKDGRVAREPAQFRSRFAMRFGEERADEKGDKVRADEVRKAFNSPFWPFVLATTSVGQEGLDFHLYCHRVIHWNLPPNPVDLEQREGRVHRFKGHAVRKNVAQRHAAVLTGPATADPWETSFGEATRSREPGDNDLVPFWVYTAPNGAAIERYVPSYALSRDIERFKALRESLALYRMVFGQPRQEELLSYLARTVPQDKIHQLAEQLKISLAP